MATKMDTQSCIRMFMYQRAGACEDVQSNLLRRSHLTELLPRWRMLRDEEPYDWDEDDEERDADYWLPEDSDLPEAYEAARK